MVCIKFYPFLIKNKSSKSLNLEVHLFNFCKLEFLRL